LAQGSFMHTLRPFFSRPEAAARFAWRLPTPNTLAS
jgi:hypothetical protein